jgi:hypothetical protein
MGGFLAHVLVDDQRSTGIHLSRKLYAVISGCDMKLRLAQASEEGLRCLRRGILSDDGNNECEHETQDANEAETPFHQLSPHFQGRRIAGSSVFGTILGPFQWNPLG